MYISVPLLKEIPIVGENDFNDQYNDSEMI